MKRDAPAAGRNLEAIAEVLVPRLANRPGDLLEIGSGTGQHALGLSARLPELVWWPSDPDPDQRESIGAWRREGGSNLRAPLALDAAGRIWPLGVIAEERAQRTVDILPPTAAGPASAVGNAGEPSADHCLDALFSANVIHIAPFEVCEGLLGGAGRHLLPGGLLFLYGPFRRNGAHTASSNADFDASLRARDPRWGVRDLEAVTALAVAQGLTLMEVVEMPANNLVVVFEHC